MSEVAGRLDVPRRTVTRWHAEWRSQPARTAPGPRRQATTVGRAAGTLRRLLEPSPAPRPTPKRTPKPSPTVSSPRHPAAPQRSVSAAELEARVADLRQRVEAVIAPEALRALGRPSAPLLDGSERVQLEGCGHVVRASGSERLVRCRSCGGTLRAVARFLPAGASAL